MDERRDNIQMIVIGDVTILSQSLESGLIDATVVPGYLSRRLADKGIRRPGPLRADPADHRWA